MINISNLIKALDEYQILKGIIYHNQEIPFKKALESPELFNVNGKLSANTDNLENGDLFVCIKGFTVDGHDLAPLAIQKGATLLITEKRLDCELPQLIVTDSRKANALAAKEYYLNPTKNITLIGITGTNGKTTIAFLTMQLLLKLGYKVGMIGTIGYYINGEKYDSERTTPDIIELNEIIIKMKEAGVQYIVMEVSSHAVALSRVYGLKFQITAFSNLSQDHLDFHKDMDDYAETKARLFDELQDKAGLSIINIDDDYGKTLYKRLNHHKMAISVNPLDNKYPDYLNADLIKFNIQNCHFKLTKKSNKITSELDITTQLIGYYNIQNLLTCMAIVDYIHKADIKELANSIPELKSAKGRIENVENNQNIGIYIDYAHTPDAVENVLKNLQLCKRNRIITVLGAGGNRDKTKRPLMAESALKWSDLLIITDDNPRNEVPSNIIRDITRNLNKEDNYLIIRDRKHAIKAAILLAKENDILVIAGKGHEEYQEINGIKYPFIETDIVRDALKEKKNLNLPENKLAIPLDVLNFEKWFNCSISNDLLNEIRCLDYVVSDSRKLVDNALFVAFKGDKFDGNEFIPQALEYSHNFCISSNDKLAYDQRVIQVNDTVDAYGFIASKLLMAFGIKKVALTGSTGKTTTKEFLFNILSEKYQVLTNQGNENNLIGVPKTILGIRPEHTLALLELGTNQFGEIEKLAKIVKPDLSIIVNIGPSHLEYLIDEAGVFKEKVTLFNYTKDIVIYPAHDSHFKGLKLNDQIKAITISDSVNADYNIHDLEIINNQLHFSLNEMGFILNDDISFKSYNASLAIITAMQFNISLDTIKKAILKPLNTQKRMEIREQNGRTLLVDCYNANPVSMKYAIEYWINYQKEKPHYAILGDMLELGEKTPEFHLEIKNQIEKYNMIDNLITVGNYTKCLSAKYHFLTVDELLENNFLEQIPQGSVVLIKASHGIHLEKILGRI